MKSMEETALGEVKGPLANAKGNELSFELKEKQEHEPDSKCH